MGTQRIQTQPVTITKQRGQDRDTEMQKVCILLKLSCYFSNQTVKMLMLIPKVTTKKIILKYIKKEKRESERYTIKKLTKSKNGSNGGNEDQKTHTTYRK